VDVEGGRDRSLDRFEDFGNCGNIVVDLAAVGSIEGFDHRAERKGRLRVVRVERTVRLQLVRDVQVVVVAEQLAQGESRQDLEEPLAVEEVAAEPEVLEVAAGREALAAAAVREVLEVAAVQEALEAAAGQEVLEEDVGREALEGAVGREVLEVAAGLEALEEAVGQEALEVAAGREVLVGDQQELVAAVRVPAVHGDAGG